MKLKNAFIAEIYKIFHSSILKVSFIFIALPLFYGMGSYFNSESISINGDFSAIGFSSPCWGLLNMTGLPNIIFTLISVAMIRGEIDKGQIKILLMHTKDRRICFISKWISIMVFIITSYLMLYIGSIISYYFFIGDNVTVHRFIDGFYDIGCIMTNDVPLIVENLFIVSIVCLLCTFLNSNICIMIGIVLSMSTVVLQFIPVIRYFDSLYMIEAYNDGVINEWYIAIIELIYITSICLVLFGANRMFCKMEIE